MLKITNLLWFKNVILSKKKSKTQKTIAPRKKERKGWAIPRCRFFTNALDSFSVESKVFILEREKERGEEIRRTLGFDF